MGISGAIIEAGSMSAGIEEITVAPPNGGSLGGLQAKNHGISDSHRQIVLLRDETTLSTFWGIP
jgi:hypothetical protein